MSNPHVLVIPYPEQGHIIPLMELSQCLVGYGIKITFVNTEHNQERIGNASAWKMKGHIGDLIHLVSFSDGLESAEDRNKPGKRSETFLRLMPRKVEELIERINASDSNKISCILADQTIGWALELAERKVIKRAAFCSASAAMLVQGFSIPKLIEYGMIDRKVGLGFSTDENGIVPRGEIKNRVEQLLSSEEIKASALELKEMVMNSIKEGGSSCQNFKKFIEWIKT
ncbi:unnamed protein product [Dovyalis caffra]|uniref:UDP-glycosyltransferase n=1 Tax=Dovyalis caffra TaxID=77055 RepID=A0AAV1SRE9_9ROSI|nr:unnamed protein product [Dovyalis caffra]